MKKIIPLTLLLVCLLVFPLTALAQENFITLRLSRDFGFSDGSGRIQGTFTITATGPETLSKVVFLLDGGKIGEDAEAPFKLQFTTDSYPLGTHTLNATGTLADGSQVSANTITADFVSAEEGWKAGLSIAGPLLGVILLIMVIAFASTMIGVRRKGTLPLGTPRSYGISGGTLCPKCGRPFALHLTKVNLLVGALDFCPHCGKWSLVRALPIQALRDAEAAELTWKKDAAQIPGESEEDKLRRELDDSRYQGM